MICILFLVGLVFAGLVGLFGGNDQYVDGIAVIEVKGSIVSGESGSSIMGGQYAGSETLMRHIREAAMDKRVKALLIQINSPGGSAAASEAVYTEILKFKDSTSKPVIAVMEDVAASGGYFIAVGAEKIFANPSTMTGSIGVIMQFNNYKELYQKYGVKVETIKSGKYKDMGNPSRSLTEEERGLLQEIVNQTYQQFVHAVMRGRSLSEEEVLKIAQGQVFTGIEAQRLNLIDHLGNFYDAVEYLAKKAGFEDEATLIYYTQPSFLERIFGGVAQKVAVLFGKPGILIIQEEIMMIKESLQDSGVENIELNY